MAPLPFFFDVGEFVEMKVAMQLIRKPGYSTRAMKPFYVTEPYAKIFEKSGKARRMTEEELNLSHDQVAATPGPASETEQDEIQTKRPRGRPRKNLTQAIE